MHLPEPITKWLPTALIAGAVGALGYFASKIVAEASGPFAQHVVPAISQTILLWICCLLSLVLLIAIAWIVFLNRSLRQLQDAQLGPTADELRKQFDDQFGEFVERYGVWKHKTKEGYYCGTCKGKGIETRMQMDEVQAICPTCRWTFYR
jgi:hypothetical protein